MQYLNVQNFSYLCQGITLEKKDMEVIDHVLIALNTKVGLLDRLVDHNKIKGPNSTFETNGPQIIVVCDKYLASGNFLTTASVILDNGSSGLPPALHINLQSPSLDIPQRIEIPLRYLIEGMIPLEGTHIVYLHALQINESETFVYYGITKRGWMKRFMEHVRLALKGKSERKFPKLLREAIIERMNMLWKRTESKPAKNILTGSYHVVCAAGRSKQDAIDIEKYLIKKRSISQEEGLNMI